MTCSRSSRAQQNTSTTWQSFCCRSQSTAPTSWAQSRNPSNSWWIRQIDRLHRPCRRKLAKRAFLEWGQQTSHQLQNWCYTTRTRMYMKTTRSNTSRKQALSSIFEARKPRSSPERRRMRSNRQKRCRYRRKQSARMWIVRNKLRPLPHLLV